MSNTTKVLVKFRYNLNPVVFTVPSGYAYDLSYLRDVEWVSSTDGLNYYSGNTVEPTTVYVDKPVFISMAVMNEVVELLRYGNPNLPLDSQHPSKIQAIKLVRDVTNCSLINAKNYVDKLCDEVNPRYPSSYDFYMDDEYPDPPF